MITVHNLSKTYHQNRAVDDISFTLSTGKCIALLGPNGAGKTTALRMMAGLISPSSGTVEMLGKHSGDIRAHIGYLPQHPHFHSWMTGREFLMYAGKLAHLSKKEAGVRADQLLTRVGIFEVRNRRISKYSGGMKQRLGIAQALIHQPEVLMLDEPVSALDPIGRRDVLNLMEELKKETTILYSTHILNDAEESSDEILLMHEGKIVESGSLSSLKARHKVDKISLQFAYDPDTYRQKLDQLEVVTRTEINKEILDVYVTDQVRAREVILNLALREHWPLLRFEMGRTTLEDLFMKVVQSYAVADRIQ
ncbi:ATP-binding cassette domain-containing protein [Halobacillus sp. K22]|uniref:ABC transporter ATP-binding protein n=1 Tax=Halobacillus sp. K22 TaxID=3457431 RepID=UPI003FCDF14D